MLSRLKAERECGALKKWLRQYHFGIVGEMLTKLLILTFRPILVDDFILSHPVVGNDGLDNWMGTMDWTTGWERWIERWIGPIRPTEDPAGLPYKLSSRAVEQELSSSGDSQTRQKWDLLSMKITMMIRVDS
jgi:hypothetical protein